MEKEELLAEVEDILRVMPPQQDMQRRTDDAHAWVGRAAAVLTRWHMPRFPVIDAAVDDVIASLDMDKNARGLAKLTALLHQARADLRMDVGPLSVVVQKGRAFDYFDELRKVIEPARIEVLFVDPYLDADFVSRLDAPLRK